MAAIKGARVRLKLGDGASPEVFTTVAGIRNVQWTISGNEIDTTTADDIDESGVTWRTYIGGIIDFGVSGDGILKDVDAMDTLIQARIADTVSNYQVELETYGVFEGPMRVTQIEGAGPFDDAGTFNIALRAASAISWTKAS